MIDLKLTILVKSEKFFHIGKTFEILVQSGNILNLIDWLTKTSKSGEIEFLISFSILPDIESLEHELEFFSLDIIECISFNVMVLNASNLMGVLICCW